MEMTMSMGAFEALDNQEMMEIDGGFFGPVLFTIWGVSVTVGHCLAAGATIGLAAGAAAS